MCKCREEANIYIASSQRAVTAHLVRIWDWILKKKKQLLNLDFSLSDQYSVLVLWSFGTLDQTYSSTDTVAY